MSKRICLISIIGCFSALFACSRPSAPVAPSLVELKSPAGAESEEPNLSVAADGRVFMSWLEPAAEGYSLLFSVRENQGEWSAPRTVAHGDDWFVNASDFPSMAVMPDGSLAAHWLKSNEGGEEAYDINIALSRDAGASWGQPLTPHRDRKPRQHGFASMLPMADGRLGVIWLDGRQTNGEGEGDMSLLYTALAPDGTVGEEKVLDNRVCDCCQTSATTTPEGVLVAYRDRSEKEVRDISLVRYSNGQWSSPQPLSKDGWEIDACPVNGPAISSNGKNVAVAWFTGANDQLRVQAVLSTDSGKTFGNPIRIDEGKPLGHVAVVSLPSGGAFVSWVERTDQGSHVRIRAIDANGNTQTPIPVSTVPVKSSGVPRMGLSGNQAIIAWTDAAIPPHVRTASLKF